MKKIYLFCSAGMSTSMLAQEMQNVADAHGLPLEVKAYSHSQVKYLYEETNRRFKETAPVAVIDASDYGMMNGEKVLKTAIKLIKSFKK